MNISVLGTLDVRENGISVTPSAPKPRQVLALLALRADQVVSVATLTEELWGRVPPRSARTTLQTYVLQLRELIAAALQQGPPTGGTRRTAKEVLVTMPGGYLLDSGDGTSDVKEFERLTDLGHRSMDAGDLEGAAEQLRQALGFWSGEAAFSGVRAGAQLAMEARRLEETRLSALDRRIEADLRLGRHRELVAELAVLVGRYPTHETLCGQYMLALHRSGRRSEALRTYQRIRTTLVRELGLEPSVDLRRIQGMILASGPDTALDL